MRRALSWAMALVGLCGIVAFWAAVTNLGQPVQIGGANGIVVSWWVVVVAAPILLVISFAVRLRLVSRNRGQRKLERESGIFRDEDWRGPVGEGGGLSSDTAFEQPK